MEELRPNYIKRFPKQPKTFTTHPKTRRHKQRRKGAVRCRAEELRDSFYPAKIVSRKAAVRRLKQMGLCDRITILNYLGRPETQTTVKVNHNVKYDKSGTNVPKTHTFRRVLPAREGYITFYELGTSKVDEWGTPWIMWNHEVQTEFSPRTPLSEVNATKDEGVKGVNGSKNFSLSFNSVSTGGAGGYGEGVVERVEAGGSTGENTGEKRERDTVRER